MIRLAALTLALTVGPAAAQQRGASPGAPRGAPSSSIPLVLNGVTVVDVEHGILSPDQRVVIVGNRIQALGPQAAVPVPRRARVIAAQGRYLIPGLWDMHTHARRLASFFYPMFIANGITGIRDAGSEVPLDTLRQWRRAILSGARVGPRALFSGPMINGMCPAWNRSYVCADDSAAARRLVDSLKAAGADLLKMYALGRGRYFAVAAEARRVGLPFGGHNMSVTPLEAADSGATIVDHRIARADTLGSMTFWTWCYGTTASVEQCQPVAEQFRRRGTWFVPTLAVDAGDAQLGASARAIFARLFERVRAFWSGASLSGNWIRDSTRPPAADPAGAMQVMQRVGVPILAGTDVALIDTDFELPQLVQRYDSMSRDSAGRARFLRWLTNRTLIGTAGFTLHAELAAYAAEGLTPLAALQTATLNPAKFLHGTDSLGTVAVGKLADLVLLDANPLADITNTTTIRAVVANGHYYDRDALDALLQAAYSTVVSTPTKPARP